MKEVQDLVGRVQAARTDPEAADALIRQYMGFIRAETAKFIKRAPIDGQDEELSIAMLAFYEAILGYEQNRGAFLSYASRGIRNRMIDHYRKEKKHAKVISLHAPLQDEDDDISKLDRLEDPKNEIEASHRRAAAREEIEEFERKLGEFGITFSEVADNCPRQERTLASCQRVLAAAKLHPEIFDILLESKKLPISSLAEKSGTDKKTLERHRKYLIAVLLAFTNGYEIIRGHLYHLSS
ncbi:MAG TPA: RNA polymerase subunit sigma [Candidatus Mediterraneibacter tabaqchaliae]|uniref:RNA polymerase sigma factor SigI n=1 Tax=Candidatus Mediterraneibacter tabaqchaliae TaxID=2838689 RepID=A0A9D2R1P6_9FIRM|nr:RNA polymerase subunit sigma [Candidatus Mediterraneibacter tabaqchaliae]